MWYSTSSNSLIRRSQRSRVDWYSWFLASLFKFDARVITSFWMAATSASSRADHLLRCSPSKAYISIISREKLTE